MTIKQLLVGHDNFCYIIYDPTHLKTAVIDPGYQANKIIRFIQDNKLKVHYIIATHYHHDHTNEINTLKKQFPHAQLGLSPQDNQNLREKTDIKLTDNYKIKLGNIILQIIHTPGHTPGGLCILVNSTALLTGDTLFINDCGRTDLPGGDLRDMFNSLQHKIKPLPNDLIIYPGHDYGPKPYDTLGNQKKTNKTLIVETFEEFSKIE